MEAEYPQTDYPSYPRLVNNMPYKVKLTEHADPESFIRACQSPTSSITRIKRDVYERSWYCTVYERSTNQIIFHTSKRENFIETLEAYGILASSGEWTAATIDPLFSDGVLNGIFEINQVVSLKRKYADDDFSLPIGEKGVIKSIHVKTSADKEETWYDVSYNGMHIATPGSILKADRHDAVVTGLKGERR